MGVGTVRFVIKFKAWLILAVFFAVNLLRADSHDLTSGAIYLAVTLIGYFAIGFMLSVGEGRARSVAVAVLFAVCAIIAVIILLVNPLGMNVWSFTANSNAHIFFAILFGEAVGRLPDFRRV